MESGSSSSESAPGVDGSIVALRDVSRPEWYPKPPERLGESLSQEWCDLWAAVPAWITRLDVPLVVRLFECRQEHADIGAQVDALSMDELVITDANGELHLHPFCAHLSDLSAGILELEQQLGLSPSSRAEMHVSVAKRWRLDRDG